MEFVSFVLQALLLFSIAVFSMMAADYLEEGKRFRFGSSVSLAVYSALLLAKFILC